MRASMIGFHALKLSSAEAASCARDWVEVVLPHSASATKEAALMLIALTIQIVNSGAGEQECADAVKLRIARRNLFGTIADLLDPAKHAVRLNGSFQGAPTTLHDRLVLRSIEQTRGDAPRHAVDEEASAARFRWRRCRRGEQRWRPISVRFLYALQLRCHLLEQLFIHRPRRVACGQTLQNPRDAGEDPAVAAAPEQLP